MRVGQKGGTFSFLGRNIRLFLRSQKHYTTRGRLKRHILDQNCVIDFGEEVAALGSGPGGESPSWCLPRLPW